MHRLWIIFLMFFLLTNISVAATENHKRRFYGDSERGWYYFEEMQKKKAKQQALEVSPSSPKSVMERLESVQKELEFRKARLVLEPTVENAKRYMEYQAKVFKNASDVSQAWQTALLKYPSLDTRYEHPVSQQAIHIKHAETEAKNHQQIAEFAKHFKLILFFRKDCKYCHAFVPVLERLREEYPFEVTAFGMDGTRLSSFHAENNRQLIETLDIQNTPTLIAYNAAHHIYFPIAQGFLPTEDLKRNILLGYGNLVSFQGDPL